MTFTDTRLNDFLAAVKPDGVYAILTTQFTTMRWVAGQVGDHSAGVTVNWGTNQIVWPNGAKATLMQVRDEGDFRKLRGADWDAVLLVYGDPAYQFPSSLQLFFDSIKHKPDFKTFSVIY